jgi:hypothetical protein
LSTWICNALWSLLLDVTLTKKLADLFGDEWAFFLQRKVAGVEDVVVDILYVTTVLLVPKLPTLKEWAYAGFTFDMLGAGNHQFLRVPSHLESG